MRREARRQSRNVQSSLQSGSSAEPRVRARADRRPRRGLRQRSVCGGEPSPSDGPRGRDRERALSRWRRAGAEFSLKQPSDTTRWAVCPLASRFLLPRREPTGRERRIAQVTTGTRADRASSGTEEADGASRSLPTYIYIYISARTPLGAHARCVCSSFERVSVCSLGYAMRLCVSTCRVFGHVW